MSRKTLPRKRREAVFVKFGGRCAYCGCVLEMKDMQVDHVVPQYSSNGRTIDGIDDIGNLLPACRQCNFYKSAYSLDGFREMLMNVLPNSIAKLFQVKIGLKYGYLKQGEPWDGKFYFERMQDNDQKV